LQKGVELMVLTGEEGSGKTTLCRLLESEALACHSIFFPRAVDSFEDVVRNITNSLGLERLFEIDGMDIDQALAQIADFLLNESVDLLLIFDEAENIFLATLERIRKMVDFINGTGARMHLLFSGQKAFLENCEQLSLCDFQKPDELHFDLEPLSEAESVDFVHDYAGRMAEVDAGKVFVDEAIRNICTLSQGNLGKLSNLVEEAAQPQNDATSFMVLLEGVKEGAKTYGENSEETIYSHLYRLLSPYFPWIGGVACCLVLFLFLFGGKNDKNDVGRIVARIDNNGKTEIVATMPEESVVAPEENDQLSEIMEPVPDAVTEAVTADVQPPEITKQVVPLAEKEVAADEMTVELSVPESAQENFDQMLNAAEQGADDKVERVTVEQRTEQVTVQGEDPEKNQNAETEKTDSVVLLKANRDLKKKNSLPVGARREIMGVKPSAEKRKGITSNVNFYTEQLYKERLLAGMGWGKKEKGKMYTVQLMALGSQGAENNLKKMLARVHYRQEAGNFYIFKKATAPESVFVFYGEYPSAEIARLAKDSLPGFLRDHKPYVLTIKQAFAKVNK